MKHVQVCIELTAEQFNLAVEYAKENGFTEGGEPLVSNAIQHHVVGFLKEHKKYESEEEYRTKREKKWHLEEQRTARIIEASIPAIESFTKFLNTCSLITEKLEEGKTEN